MKFTSEFTVGIITVLAIILLVFITFQLESFDVFSKNYTLYARFTTISGLEEGAPVQVSGVPVGKITQIKRVSDNPPVQVQFTIPKTTDLFSNATVRISTSGMLGEKFLDIDPGSAHGGKLVEGGMMFNGQPPVEIDQVLEQTPAIMNDLAETIVAIKEFVVDKENQESIRGTLKSVRHSTQQIEDILTSSSGNINRMIASMEQTAKQMDELTSNVNVFVADIRKDFDSSRKSVAQRYEDFSQKTDAILSNVQDLTNRLSGMSGRVDKAFTENQPKFKEISSNLTELSQQLASLTEGVNQGKGTLGKLATDPRPFQDLQAILERLRALIEGGASGLQTQIQYEKKTGASKTAPSLGTPAYSPVSVHPNPTPVPANP